jgi:hypothetical protein
MTELARNEIAADTIELAGDRTKNGLRLYKPIRRMMMLVSNALSRDQSNVVNWQRCRAQAPRSPCVKER